ncbi:MAG: DUF559 domain-containing protein, partial [Actinobacteria bacterium]|nr:DUF559 domain-containing protein [Actinomycetota bacterium]
LLPSVLAAAGITPRQCQYRASQGEWKRLDSGIYVVAGHPESFEMHALAALAAVPNSVLSHRAAATAWRFGVSSHPDIELTTSLDRRVRLGGITVVRSPLTSLDVTRRGAFRLTTLERTIVDLGSVVGDGALLRVVEDQLITGRTTHDRLGAAVGRLCRAGRRGSARVRRVMGHLDDGAPTESELERLFIRVTTQAGVGPFDRQAALPWSPEERGRVDFVDRSARVIFELDGRAYHARLAAFDRDRQRDQSAAVAGWRTIRFTWTQLRRERQRVVEVVRGVLAA